MRSLFLLFATILVSIRNNMSKPLSTFLLYHNEFEGGLIDDIVINEEKKSAKLVKIHAETVIYEFHMLHLIETVNQLGL